MPITITNTQNSAVPSHFQQMIQFSPSTYAIEEAPDLGNIRFYYGSEELYSWCEANCSSSSTGNAIFWVKTPHAIPPGKNITIDMYFLPSVVEYDGDFAGEAPQLSNTYGQYDNGAKVFEFYEGFEGVTLPPELNQYAPSGAAISVNKGLTINTGTASWAGVITTSNFTPPVIFDAYVASQSGGALSGGIAEQAGSQHQEWIAKHGYHQAARFTTRIMLHILLLPQILACQPRCIFLLEYTAAAAATPSHFTGYGQGIILQTE